MKRSRIAIVSTGRFHVLDLARELHALGFDVTFYSILSTHRAAKFGLPRHCQRSFYPFLFPLIVLWRFSPKRLTALLDRILQLVVDYVAAISLRECDLFIGMSGLCVESARVAREKYGAPVFIERGSRHILSQKQIMETLVPESGPSTFAVDRELWGYEYANVVVVPSHHVVESFLEYGVARNKLFRNPYGVDLSMFPATEREEIPNTVLFVGSWSLRKGCDVLWRACKAIESTTVVHVGAIRDAPVPNSSRFRHYESVDQTRLVQFYRRAHVFVHASREEGLSLVILQAIACGLPVVCTDRTGGEDVRESLDDPKFIVVVPTDDTDALRNGIQNALTIARGQVGIRDVLGCARCRFSWSGYAKRYAAEIERRLSLAHG